MSEAVAVDLGITQLTPAEAAARLAELSSNAEWSKNLLNGNGPETRQFNELIAKKAEVDKTDQLLSGTLSTEPFAMNEAGISPRNAVESVGWLREAGVSDGAIREVFDGKPASRADYDAVARLRAELLGNAEWVKKLLSGDHEAKRQLTLMSIVRSNGFKEEKAA